jgi:hypothetical protein
MLVDSTTVLKPPIAAKIALVFDFSSTCRFLKVQLYYKVSETGRKPFILLYNPLYLTQIGTENYLIDHDQCMVHKLF